MFEKNVIFAGGFRLDVDKLFRVSNSFSALWKGDCYRERNQQLKANFVQLLLVAEFVSSGIYAQKDEEQHCEAPQR